MNSEKSTRIFMPIFHGICFIVFVGMGYWFNQLLALEPVELNHFFTLVGGFGTWLAYVCFLNFIAQNSYHRKYNWFTFIAALIGMFATFFLLMTGMLLGITPLVQNAETAFSYNTLFVVHSVLFVYVSACFWFIWRKYNVAKGSFVIFEGNILYPDTEYIMWPFFHYEYQTVEEDINLSMEDVAICCKDVQLEIDTLQTTVEIDIAGARKRGCDSFDLQEFKKIAKEKILKVIAEETPNITYGELRVSELPEIRMDIMNFPVTWDGEIEYLDEEITKI